MHVNDPRFGCAVSNRVDEKQPEPTTILQEISRRIRAANQAANLILDRLSAVGERVFGSPPVCTAQCNDQLINGNGALDQIFLALSALDQTLTLLEAAENHIHELA